MEKRRLVRWLAAVAALAFALVARPAAAVVLSDPASGFRFEARAPGLRECVIHPESLRDPAGCVGEDLPTAAPMASGSTRELGTIRFIEGERRFAVTVLTATTPGQTEMTRATAREFVEGFRRGVEQTPGMRVAAGAPGSEVELVNLNGRQALRHVVTMASTSTPDGPNRYVAYHVVGRDAVVTVLFFTWGPDLPWVESHAARMVQSVAMDPPRPAMEGTAAYKAGQACGSLMCVGMLGMLVVLAVRALTKKSPPPPPPPPYPPQGGPWQGGGWQPPPQQGGPWQPPPQQGGPWQPPPGGYQGPGGA